MNNKCLNIKEMSLFDFCNKLKIGIQDRLVMISENRDPVFTTESLTNLGKAALKKYVKRREEFQKSLPSKLKHLTTYDVLTMWRRNAEKYLADQDEDRRKTYLMTMCTFVEGLRKLGYPQQKIDKIERLTEIKEAGTFEEYEKRTSSFAAAVTRDYGQEMAKAWQVEKDKNPTEADEVILDRLLVELHKQSLQEAARSNSLPLGN